MSQTHSGTPEELATALFSHYSEEEVREWIKQYALPYRELMGYFRCAIMEVETKFRVLSEELSLDYDHNPIETIKSRLKSPESILEKMKRNDWPFSVESIEENLHDVAGVRVITSFVSDIYMLADAFLQQDDIFLLEKKDYIQNPKPNGYRSLHLIVRTPIFLHDRKRMMKVEVQFRTISMDFWASTEHKLRYKKEISDLEQLDRELLSCAEMGAMLDQKMECLKTLVGL